MQTHRLHHDRPRPLPLPAHVRTGHRPVHAHRSPNALPVTALVVAVGLGGIIGWGARVAAVHPAPTTSAAPIVGTAAPSVTRTTLTSRQRIVVRALVPPLGPLGS
jgi:hypothetical protein